jgi:hypothetical protein
MGAAFGLFLAGCAGVAVVAYGAAALGLSRGAKGA